MGATTTVKEFGAVHLSLGIVFETQAAGALVHTQDPDTISPIFLAATSGGLFLLQDQQLFSKFGGDVLAIGTKVNAGHGLCGLVQCV